MKKIFLKDGHGIVLENLSQDAMITLNHKKQFLINF